MSENENIEAKLCSYVEGDLDAEGRAEIEKYLLAHPRYRPLIEELSRTRGLLRDLPREPAPAELLEALSGQIERSALLGDDQQGSMRIHSSRMPQLAAWAAVLVLMSGLALVVYRVLPANKPEVVLLKAPAPTVNTSQSVANEFQKSPSDLDRQDAAALPVKDQLSQVAPATLAVADAQLESAKSAPAATAPAIASATVMMDGTVAGNAALRQQTPPGTIVGGDATRIGQNMYVTLRAFDTKVANERLTSYLNDKQITYESRTAAADTGSFAFARQRALAAPVFAKDATTSPSSESAGFDPAAMRPAAAMGARAGAMPPSIQMQAHADDAGNVIIARNLSAEQVKKLTDDLAIQVSPSAQTPAPATQEVATEAEAMGGEALLKSGQAVRIVARDNGLPGVEAMNEQQTIDADGNVSLPLVGKIKAAGLTGNELAAKIPQAYRDAKSPTTATWAIDRIAAVPPTTGVTPSPAPPVAAATMPSTSPTTLSILSDGLMGGENNHPGIDVTIRVVKQAVPTTSSATGTNVLLPDDMRGDTTIPILPTDDQPATAPTTIPSP